MKNVALHNLGCKVNSYEIEVMQQMLQEKGYNIVPFDEMADIYIVNTCTVTNIADRKSRQMLHRAKQKNPSAIVVAVGCYVQTGKENVEKDECIDLAIGNNRKKDIATILEQFLAERDITGRTSEGDVHTENETLKTRTESGPKEEREQHGDEDACHDMKQGGAAPDKTLHNTTVIDINNTYEYEEMTLHQTAEHTRAYIKIQDGCNQFCSYCVIPYARGRVRSRHAEDIMAEIWGMAEAGYREIVLTGIHISSYGIDFEENEWQQGRSVETHRANPQAGEKIFRNTAAGDGEYRSGENCAEEKCAGKDYSEERRDYSGKSKLIDLVEKIHDIPGIERIRLGSLEPRIVTEETARRLAALPKICPHFHLSLQSGCDDTLKRMNRHYTVGEYFRSVGYLRETFDHPAITTDIIVGFAGETEEEFAQTKAFLEKIKFYEMHIFKYSKRAGTRAAVMPNQVPDQVKTVRSNELLSMESLQSKEFRSRYIGKNVEVLFEEKKEIGGRTYFIGHTKDYVKVAVLQPEIPEGEEVHPQTFVQTNSLADVKVRDFLTDEILLAE